MIITSFLNMLVENYIIYIYTFLSITTKTSLSNLVIKSFVTYTYHKSVINLQDVFKTNKPAN